MTTFLLHYSDDYEAKKDGFPEAGTAVEIETLDDLDALSESLGCHAIIFKDAKEGAPIWAYNEDTFSEADREFYHCLERLPDGWQTMRWLEVYNGYRE